MNRRTGSPKRREDLTGSVALGRVRRDDLDGRAADLRLESRGRALGDDAAVVDDPDPVGERVGLFEVLRREEDGDAFLFASRSTSSQSAVRLWMSRPVVGSSRNRMLGEWTSARARSSRRFIPPEYVRDLAVGGLGQADALEELVAARFAAARAASPEASSGA